MDKTTIQRYGDELYQALISRTAVDPLTDREPEITIEDAYQIQLRMIQRRIDAGETIVGKKIGVTSKVVMDMLKVDQPDFGQMTSGMVFNEGEAIRTDSMIAPKAEAEIAFVLKRDLAGPGRHRGRRAACHRLRRCRASRSSTRASRTGRSRSRTPWPTTRPAAY